MSVGLPDVQKAIFDTADATQVLAYSKDPVIKALTIQAAVRENAAGVSVLEFSVNKKSWESFPEDKRRKILNTIQAQISDGMFSGTDIPLRTPRQKKQLLLIHILWDMQS